MVYVSLNLMAFGEFKDLPVDFRSKFSAATHNLYT